VSVLDLINQFDDTDKFEYVSDVFGTDTRMFDKTMIIDAIKDLSENVSLLDIHPAYGHKYDSEGNAINGWYVTDTDIIWSNRLGHETIWRKVK